MKSLIWYHRDLRTHDHAGLSQLLAERHSITAIVFAPPPPCSSLKFQFWVESVTDLRQQLASIGVPLITGSESPIKELPLLVSQHDFCQVLTHERMNSRDQALVDEVRNALKVPLITAGELTLFSAASASGLSLADLRPFTKFKQRFFGNWPIAAPIERPQGIKLASLASTTWSRGGEHAGLERLQNYLWETRAATHYHQTRNGLLERDDSSKFSRWLAWGCLSPRLLYQELKRLEETPGGELGAQALIYELIWRDYFKFLARVVGARFFRPEGLRDARPETNEEESLFESWSLGHTGADFVDANMKELLATGNMSNRGRQNVASYLAKTLCADWTQGARWFEEHLIDEDPENNWGNWLYLAGVGTDPRDRKFDVVKQAQDYDPTGAYRRRWLKPR